MKYKACVCCGYEFSALNVFTEAGARETAISGTCEKCFDEMFEGTDDDSDDWGPD